jgi:hypothetical protein
MRLKSLIHLGVFALTLLSLTAAAPRSAQAEILPARETADVLSPGQYAIGVFNPLRIGTFAGELEVHPLVMLVAPHVTLRSQVRAAEKPGDWRWSLVSGLSLPSGAWRLAKPLGLSGDLVPSCKVAGDDPARGGSCDRPGWLLAGKLGLVASKGFVDSAGQERGMLTLRMEAAGAWTLFGQEGRPLHAWAPVEVQMAPEIGQSRSQVRVAYDHAVADFLRLRAELGGYLLSRPIDDLTSPWVASGYVGADLRTSQRTRLTLGAMYWNSDRHQREVTKGSDGFAQVEYVRTHEVWPTLDFLWQW